MREDDFHEGSRTALEEFLQPLLVEKPRSDLKVLQLVLAREGWKRAGI
jgi:hypothetical protein